MQIDTYYEIRADRGEITDNSIQKLGAVTVGVITKEFLLNEREVGRQNQSVGFSYEGIYSFIIIYAGDFLENGRWTFRTSSFTDGDSIGIMAKGGGIIFWKNGNYCQKGTNIHSLF